MMYHAITFGPSNENRYWNYHTYHATQFNAEQWCLNQLPIAGTFGYVIIEEENDSWAVIEEFGTENTSVSTCFIGKYSIQPSPKLVFV